MPYAPHRKKRSDDDMSYENPALGQEQWESKQEQRESEKKLAEADTDKDTDTDTDAVPEEAEKRYWHMGFYGGMEIELSPWRERLTFIHEYPLTKKSLVADMLIIKKPPDTVITNDIGRFFKGHNLLEFKSASDYLSVDAFYRALSYAYLYKSQGAEVDRIRLSDVTLTILCFPYPQSLFSALKDDGVDVTEESAGVYRLDGYHSLSVHVVVIPRLPRGTHMTLRLLRPKADFGEYVRFLDEVPSIDREESRNIEAFIHIVTKANPLFVKLMEKEKSMELMDDATLHASIRRIFANLFAEDAEKVRRETAERIERETAERIERETAERIERETAERVRQAKQETVRKVQETAEKDQKDFITRLLQNHAPINLIEASTLAPREKIMEIARSIGVTPVT